ncbi:unnamed protein product [Lathyrus oleraceus]
MDTHYCFWISATLFSLFAGYFCVSNFVWRLNEWYYNLKQRNKQYPLPPGDLGWPFIGDMLTFVKHFSSGHPDSFIKNIVSKYGRNGIYKSHLFGSPSIIICEADLIMKVLTDDETYKFSYPKSTVELLKYKPYWSFSRKEQMLFRRIISSLTLNNTSLENYLSNIEEIMVKSLEDFSSMNRPVELLKEMKNVSFKVIVGLFMGSYDERFMSKIGNSFSHMHSALFCMPFNLPGFAFRRGLIAREKLAKLVKPIVKERRLMIRKGDKKNLLDILLQVNDEDGWKPDDDDIIQMLIAMVLAGHETTAHGLMWSIIYLTQNPHIMKKAKEEQEEIMKAREGTKKKLSFEEIKKMVYLSQVIDETLRHISLTFTLFRETTRDVNINGYIIPKGWKVLPWLKSIHKDPAYYSNPDEFNPSRWNDHDTKHGTFIPFGVGSRHCPGNSLAKIEIYVFLHYFILNYKLERVNPDCPITCLPAPMPTDNCLAKVIKVSSS